MTEHPLQAAMLNAPDLARISGVSVWTIRAIINGDRVGSPDTRRKLAAALRQHSEKIATLADELERT